MAKFVVFVVVLIVGCRHPDSGGLKAVDQAAQTGSSCERTVYRILLPPGRTGQPQPGRAPLQNMTRDMMVHGLSFFTAPGTVRVENTAESGTLNVPCDQVYPGARQKFLELSQAETYLDAMGGLKTLLGSEHYDGARNHRWAGMKFFIPATAGEFEAQTNFRRWQGRVVANSVVKGVTRALYCSPKGFSPRVAVAQTHSDTTGSRDTPVRETEIMVERLGEPKGFDFFVYGPQGRLARESEFRNSRSHVTVGPSPHSCLACHYDGINRIFQNRPLTFGGIPYPERLELPSCFRDQTTH